MKPSFGMKLLQRASGTSRWKVIPLILVAVVALPAAVGLLPRTGATGTRPATPSIESTSPASPGATATPAVSPTVLENRLPGSKGLNQSPTDTGIAGYADATSVNVGGVIRFAISTGSPAYDLDVYRVGWYGGVGSRLLLSVRNLSGQNQGFWLPNTYGVQACPTCRIDTRTGLLDAGWQISYPLHVPSTWVSGNYLVKLTTPRGEITYIPFVLRDDSYPSGILAVMPVNTYQAYNDWGGVSLYRIDDSGPPTVAGTRGVKVSFNRPYNSHIIFPRASDFGAVEFLERNGYDVTYATNIDIDRDPTILLRHRAFVSIGHDEYWSRQTRINVEHARNSGVNLAFLGGNDVYRQVRYEADAQGRAGRTLVCYKSAALDPLASTDPPDATLEFVKPPINRPQNALTGTLFDLADEGYPPRGGVPWVVAPSAPSWLLAGSSLVSEGAIPKIGWYECDRAVNNGVQPPGLQIVGTSSFTNGSGQPTVCNSTWYRTVYGSEVFSAGTMGWTVFLSDPRVSRMTINLLDRFTRR